MEKLSHILTMRLIQKDVITAEKSAVYQYGFQMGLEVCLNTLISILIAVICHMEIECLLFFALFIPLRAFAGGLHLSKYITCLIGSCTSLFGILLLVKYVDMNSMTSLGVAVISALLIKLIAPVEHINRPLSEAEIQEFSKKLDVTLLAVLIVAILFYFMQLQKLLFMVAVTLLFMTCILVLGKVSYNRDKNRINREV